MTDDELGLLVWCALGYDRRLPSGLVPERVWDQLTPQWREKINRWRTARCDVLGAEVKPRG